MSAGLKTSDSPVQILRIEDFMAISTDEVRSTLTGLAEICKDGEEGYRDAATKVTASSLKTMFNEYAAQRAGFASELQTTVAKLGGEPSKAGTLAGAAHRGWLNLKGMITGHSDSAIIAECEAGEDSAVKHYREALAKDVPTEIRSLIETQFAKVQAAHNTIRDLKHQTSNS